MKIDRFLKLKRFKRILIERFFGKFLIKKWICSNKIGVPPHVIKRKNLLELAKNYNCRILVETGTYLGDMVYFNLNNFDKIYSIELSSFYYRNAKELFKKKKNVEILFGDSSEVLKDVTKKIDKQALFWLDGHYSGGLTASGNLKCPILKELEVIFNDNKFKNIIMIDDANAFDGTNDYPEKGVLQTIANNNNYSLELKDNAFILIPR